MIKQFYHWLRNKTSREDEQGEHSAGHWHDQVRSKAIELFDPQFSRVLEVGCGEGLFLTRLAKSYAQLQIDGLDILEEPLKRAENRLSESAIHNVTLTLGQSQQLPYGDKTFDVVFCINMFVNLPSVEEIQKTLKEISRVCKDHGELIFDFRNSRNPLLNLKYALARYYDETVRDLPLRTYSSGDFRRFLEGSGFTMVLCEPVSFPKNMFSPLFVVKARKQTQ